MWISRYATGETIVGDDSTTDDADETDNIDLATEGKMHMSNVINTLCTHLYKALLAES